MWCHTRVQGLTRVGGIQARGRFQRETGPKKVGRRCSCEHFGERTRSEEMQESKWPAGGVPTKSERAILREGSNRGCSYPYRT